MNEKNEILIRPEDSGDCEAIAEITLAAFEGQPYSDQTEARLIRDLRAAGALSLSLVAVLKGEVVGHIAFSKVLIGDSDAGWYGIGPLSVKPGFQRQGIGSALMKTSLEMMKERGAGGCVLVGDPDYYRRFGFTNLPGLILREVPPKNFMGLAFDKDIPQGEVVFHEAFLSGGR